MIAPMSPTHAATEVDSSGFRRRGFEVTRLAAFVDAAFAFAVTLLVISLDGIPNSVAGLVDALKGIPAFAASFALLAQIWWTHARYTWRFGLEDGRTIALSLLLVFLVLVYVYPLKILFGTGFSWITGGWIPTQFRITSVADLRAMFIIYGAAWSLLGLTLVELYRHAWSLRGQLGLSAEEAVQVRLQIVSYAFFPVLGTLSMLAAWCIPEQPAPWMVALPGLVFFGMFLQWPVLAAARRRLQPRAP